MTKGLRAEIEISDIKILGHTNSYQTVTSFSGVSGFSLGRTAVEIKKVFDDFIERNRVLSEISAQHEINKLIKELEASIPQGEEAELIVSGFQPGKGFDFVGVQSPGQTTLSSDDRTSPQRSHTIKLTGKADPSKVVPSIGVQPAGVDYTSGVNFIPSSQKKELVGQDRGMRIEIREVRRVDSMSYPDRHTYEHTDRLLA